MKAAEAVQYLGHGGKIRLWIIFIDRIPRARVLWLGYLGPVFRLVVWLLDLQLRN